MTTKIIALVICVAVIGLAWTSYWLWKWQKEKHKGAESDEEAQFIADIRNNISRQVSSAFCAVHHTALDDEERVKMRFENVSYHTTLMILTIDTHWLKAYFDWYKHKVHMEFYLGGENVATSNLHYKENGIIDIAPLLSLFQKYMEEGTEIDGKPVDLATLYALADETREVLYADHDYDELVPAIVQDAIDRAESPEDIAAVVALITIMTEDKKARDAIEKKLAAQAEEEQEDEQSSFLLDKRAKICQTNIYKEKL